MAKYLNLVEIRKGFKPRLTHRWLVEFKDTLTGYETGFFPASDVAYDRFQVESESVEVAPGVTFNIPTVSTRPSKITITFYETIDKQILKFLRSRLDKTGIKEAKYSPQSSLIITIKHYNNNLNSDFYDQFYVELISGYTESLGQDSTAYTGTLELSILGIYNEFKESKQEK